MVPGKGGHATTTRRPEPDYHAGREGHAPTGLLRFWQLNRHAQQRHHTRTPRRRHRSGRNRTAQGQAAGPDRVGHLEEVRGLRPHRPDLHRRGPRATEGGSPAVEVGPRRAVGAEHRPPRTPVLRSVGAGRVGPRSHHRTGLVRTVRPVPGQADGAGDGGRAGQGLRRVERRGTVGNCGGWSRDQSGG